MLKRHECFYINRMRLGLSQLQMRKKLGLCKDYYQALEHSDDAPEYAPTPKISKVSPIEMCILLRRRAGLTQAELAKKLGCSRGYVVKMEKGEAPITLLVRYWGITCA